MQLTTAAFLANGSKHTYECGSTDPNMPMSLGIPAVTIPRVGKADRSHSLDGWIDIDPENNHTVKKTILTAALAVSETQ